MKNLTLTTAFALLVTATVATAQPVIDGTVTGDVDYGAALSTNLTDTGFGNSTDPDPLLGLGSEIDQVFGVVSGGRLYVTVTGNLETNFNKLEVFIDSDAATGVNTLVGASLPGGYDAFCCGGFESPKGNNTTNFGGLQRMDGLTFDTGFTADYALAFSHGGESVRSDFIDPLDSTRKESPNRINFYAMNAHYADLTQGTAGAVVAAGVALAPSGQGNVLRASGDGLLDTPDSPTISGATSVGPALPGLGVGQLVDRTYAMSANGGCTDDLGTGCIAPELEFVLDVDATDQNALDPGLANLNNHRNFVNTVDLWAAINNSNIAGVEGDGAPIFTTLGDPQNVETGIEFSIPLSSIGNPTGDIKLTAFVNGSGHDYVSNQFSGFGETLGGNLGGDGTGGFTGDLGGIDFSTVTGDQFVTIANSVVIGPGDYNSDGTVDAADYTVWRDGLSPDSSQAGYDLWVANYGNVGSASTSNAVPEPGTLILLGLAAVGMVAGRRS